MKKSLHILGLLLAAFFASCSEDCEECAPCASITNEGKDSAYTQDSVPAIHDTIHDTIKIYSKPQDTTYFRDTIYIYKDTVYDTSYLDKTYRSFIYQKPDNTLDTVTALASNLDCETTGDTFHCRLRDNRCLESAVIYDYNKKTIGPAPAVIICQIGSKCISTIDTIRVDSSYHKTQIVILDDTLRINYGDGATTKYIPSMQIPPLNKDSIRLWLDTLDTRAKDFNLKTFQSPYTLTGKNLPDKIRIEKDDWNTYTTKITNLDFCNSSFTDYPPKLDSIPSTVKNYLQEPLPNDTTITWTLIYEDQNGMKDSMEVTSLFLGGAEK